MRTATAGTRPVVRLVLRRDRFRLPVWVVLLVVVPAVTPPSLAELFPNEAARAGYAGGVRANPALLAIQGPVFDTSLGALTAGRSLTLTAVLVALLSVLTVVRHTRAEEEEGRRELLGATRVGRHAGLAAVLVVMLGADVVIGAGVGAALAAAGLPLGGSIAFGASLTVAGLVFAGVSAVAAQLTTSARSATGIAIGVLGIAVVLRAAGDAGGATLLSWTSPLGWTAQVRPFAGDRWWVLMVSVAMAAALVAVATVLAAGRDLAAGVLPPRLGPATGTVRSPLGLAWRLQRGAALGWVAAFIVVGAALGGIAQGIGDLLDASPETVALLRRLGGGDSIVDVFLAAEFAVLGLLAAASAIAAVLRLRTEESAGRAEIVLAGAVGRTRWAGSHLAVAVLAPAVALLGAGVAAGAVRAVATGDAGEVGRLAGGALAQLPAVWVLAGIAMALFGVLPHWTVGAWAVLVAFLMFGQLGQLLRLPQWLLDLSPFTHLPRSLGTVDMVPLLWLAAVAAGLVIIGLVGLCRRDLTP